MEEEGSFMFDEKTVKLKKEQFIEAKSVAALIKDLTKRKLAFANTCTLFAFKNYVEKNNYKYKPLTNINLFRVPAVYENFEISDLYLGDIRIDVRVSLDGKVFPLPKTHINNSIAADFYVIFKGTKNPLKCEALGYMKKEDLIFDSQDDSYYYISVALLNPISDLKNEIENFVQPQKTFYDSEHKIAQENFGAFLDGQLDEVKSLDLIKHLLNCSECRSTFVEFGFLEDVLFAAKYFPEQKDSVEKELNKNDENAQAGTNPEKSDNGGLVEGVIGVAAETISAVGEVAKDIAIAGAAAGAVSAAGAAAETSAIVDVAANSLSIAEDVLAEQEIPVLDEDTIISNEENFEIFNDDIPSLDLQVDEHQMTEMTKNLNDCVMEEDDGIVDLSFETLDENKTLDEYSIVENNEFADETVNLEINESVDELYPEEQPSVAEEEIFTEESFEPITEEPVLEEINKSATEVTDFEEVEINSIDDIIVETVQEEATVIEDETSESEQNSQIILSESDNENTFNESSGDSKIEIKDEDIGDFMINQDNTISDMEVQTSVFDDTESPISIDSDSTIEINFSDIQINDSLNGISDANEFEVKNEDISNLEKDEELQKILYETPTESAQQGAEDIPAEANWNEIFTSSTKQEAEPQLEPSVQEDVLPEPVFEKAEFTEPSDIDALYSENTEEETPVQEQIEEQIENTAIKEKKSAGMSVIIISVFILFAVAAGCFVFFDKNSKSEVSEDFGNNPSNGAITGQPQDLNKAMTNAFSDTQGSLKISKVSWAKSPKVELTPELKEFLSAAGDAIWNRLDENIMSVQGYIASQPTKILIKINKDGEISEMKIGESCGAKEVDDMILQETKLVLEQMPPSKYSVTGKNISITLLVNF